MSSADERIPGHTILQQINVFILQRKILAVLCLDVSVRFRALSSASAKFLLASDPSSGCPFPLRGQQKGWHIDTWLGWGGSNEGTALGEFSSPFRGCSTRNRVLRFYFSHVSHAIYLIIDEIVRS